MNFDSYLSHQTPPQRSNCRRQNAWLDTKAQPKDARRTRREPRRTRSVPAKSDADSSSSSDSDVCLKKKRDEFQTEGGSSVESVRCRPYGKISVVGRRREMEDVVVVELGFLKRGMESYDFFGVFDGHGGWRVAHACGKVLHKMLAKIAGEDSGQELDWEAVMAAGFNMMEVEVKGVAPVSSVVVVVVGENEVVVANCGGSRVVLSSGGVAIQMLEDYKVQPDSSEAAGGDAVPAPTSTPIDELACQVGSSFCGRGSRSGGAVAAAALMAELAVARGSKDNISIIVVDLRGIMG